MRASYILFIPILIGCTVMDEIDPADDMYFPPTIDSRTFKINGEPGNIDRVTKWLTNYVDTLMLPNGLIVEKAWLALVNKLDENGGLEDVCVGTNEKLTAQEYMDRRRETGDFHGQAPMLWTSDALILLDKKINDSENAENK